MGVWLKFQKRALYVAWTRKLVVQGGFCFWVGRTTHSGDHWWTTYHYHESILTLPIPDSLSQNYYWKDVRSSWITEPLEVCRDLWGLCSARSCSEQGQLEQVHSAQHCLTLFSFCRVWCSLPWCLVSRVVLLAWRWIAFISYRLSQPFFLAGKVQAWSCCVLGSVGFERGGGGWDWAMWESLLPIGILESCRCHSMMQCPSWSEGSCSLKRT